MTTPPPEAGHQRPLAAVVRGSDREAQTVVASAEPLTLADLTTGPAPFGLVGDELSLWQIRASEEARHALRLAPALLDRAELDRLAAYRRPELATRFAVAHVVLRLALAARSDTDPAEIRLDGERCKACGAPHGRPRQGGCTRYFSLSRSGDRVLLAFASRPVGVDVERIPTPRTLLPTDIALHDVEAQELAVLSASRQRAAFCRAWVRKEAYLKGLGVGLCMDPSHIYVGTGTPHAANLPGWALYDVMVTGPYVAAVAVH